MENFDNFKVRVISLGKTETHHPQKNWVVVSNFSCLYLHPFLAGNDPISRTYFVRCGGLFNHQLENNPSTMAM